MDGVPKGLCQCGCGGKTRLSPDNKYGNEIGEPKKFLHGHMFKNHETHPSWKGGRKKCCSGRYMSTKLPGHPRADKEGYVLEHIVIVEKALGKELPLKAKVHHADGDGTNNENSNLVACEDNDYHRLLHVRMRAYEACGHASWRKCWICQKWDDPKNLRITNSQVCHSGCQHEYQTLRRKIRNGNCG